MTIEDKCVVLVLLALGVASNVWGSLYIVIAVLRSKRRGNTERL